MPAKLSDECSKYTCRLLRADMELILKTFPGKRDEVLRDLVHRYADVLRARDTARLAG